MSGSGLGPAVLSVGPRRSLCRDPTLFASGRSPALTRSLCRFPGSLSGAWRSLRHGPALARRSLCWAHPFPRPRSSDPRVHPHVTNPVRGPQLRSLCHPPGPACQPSAAGPQLRSACPSGPLRSLFAGSQLPPQTPPAQTRVPPIRPAHSLFPGENPKPYCLGEMQGRDTKMGVAREKGDRGKARARHKHRDGFNTLEIQIAQSRQYSYTLGPKVVII